MKKLIMIAVLMLVQACSSAGAPSPALEPVETVETVGGEPAETPIESPVSAAFETLRARLTELGYEGVGLELETVESIERLQVVFSDPAAAGRRIKQIYTGAANDYDANNESVTLSGSDDAGAILAFLRKKVPLAGAQPVATPVRRAKPATKAKPK